MKAFIVIIFLILTSCNKEDDPAPLGCVMATSPDGGVTSFGCFTESQFNFALANGGKVGSGTNTIHPDWAYYTDHYWELCAVCK